jgi:xanthine dehydrogenase accessory factor
MAGGAARPVWVFGAGPIGTALVPSLPALGFAVTWVDARRASFPAALPPGVAVRISADPCRLLRDIPDGAFILIMTYSATLDLALVAETLDGARFPFVGMVGSAAKRMRFIKRLIEAGMARQDAARLVCPIGASTGVSKLPAAIAAGIIGELLVRSAAAEPALDLLTTSGGER